MWPLSDPRIAAREFSRIVVRLPNWMGDQILATPALHAVRDRYPRAHIALHGPKSAEALFAGAPYMDEFFPVVSKHVREEARRLRGRGFDACLLLTGSFRTALVAFLARIPHRIGYRRSGRTALLTAHRRRPRPGGRRAPYPTKQYFLDLVAELGARGGGRVRLPLPDGVRARADAWLASHGIGPEDPVLSMCVGASFGPSKLWPAASFARVADAMAERHGAKVVVLCGPGEEPIGEAVRTHATRPLVDTGLAPLPVDMLKAVIARSRVMLTNDTGPRHIAACFRVPVVCLMGPTDPTYTETDLEETVVLREDVECSPCHLKVCPIDHRCMTRLSPERALAAVEGAWGVQSRG